jgi:hypothetical protein
MPGTEVAGCQKVRQCKGVKLQVAEIIGVSKSSTSRHREITGFFVGTELELSVCIVADFAAIKQAIKARQENTMREFKKGPPAVWVQHYHLDNNITVSVSEKAGLRLTETQSGAVIMYLNKATATALCNISGDLGNILSSEEYKLVEESNVKTKELSKIQKQVQTEAQKAIKTVQASLDKLKVLGYTDEQARAMLKIA